MTLSPLENNSETVVVTSMNDTDASDFIKAETDSLPEPTSKRGLKVLFLSSDTGGGHRASAESLARQFQLLYPGSTYDLLDVVEKDGVAPYNSLVPFYQHLSAHPAQWKLVYSVSNTRAYEYFFDAHLKVMCERAFRRRIKGYDPDVVISVHPLMCNVPILSCKKIGNETGKHLPMFTVVTDLGSAHAMWFANGVEKMFVGSDQIMELAKKRGKVPDEKLIKIGLPIRHDFAEQSERFGDRMSPEGKAYQRSIQKELSLPLTEGDFKTILVMGGGEGVGSLASIVDALYCELVSQGIDAQILVVCGRNEKLKKNLDERNWIDVINRWVRAKEQRNRSRFRIRDCVGVGVSGLSASSYSAAGCIEGGSGLSSLRRILSQSSVGAAISAPLSISRGTSRSSSRSGSVKGDSIEEEKKDDIIISKSAESVEVEDLQQGLDLSEGNLSDNEDASLSPKESKESNISVSPKEGEMSGKTSPTFPNEASIDLSECNGNNFTGQVKVVGLGFVTKMAEYMVAADVLVSKAGPGTISEAAALSLPVMLTSFLPGQEEGNVDYVVDNNFGAFCSDKDPNGIAEELCMWLTDSEKMNSLSKAAKQCGAPYAARDIAKDIGDRALKWRELNEKNEELQNMKKTTQ